MLTNEQPSKSRAVEPLVEEIEDREQALFGSRAALPRLGLDPAVRPDHLALLEEGEDELVLRREVPVERRLRDGGTLDDLLDADRADPPRREELVGALENSVAGDRLGTHRFNPIREVDRPV